jgi:hypothetical protein
MPILKSAFGCHAIRRCERTAACRRSRSVLPVENVGPVSDCAATASRDEVAMRLGGCVTCPDDMRELRRLLSDAGVWDLHRLHEHQVLAEVATLVSCGAFCLVETLPLLPRSQPVQTRGATVQVVALQRRLAPPPRVREQATEPHWIEIELTGEDGRPIPHEAYNIVTPDGKRFSGRLDSNGRARVDAIAVAGDCQVSFTALDEGAWDLVSTSEIERDAACLQPPASAT